MEKRLTGPQLEKALKSEVFEQTGTELIGMVKSSEKEGYIAFTRSGCEHWVDIPTSMIEDAEQIGRSRCKDHFHPLFKITLKLPQTPEATVLASLLGPAVAAAETYPQAATPMPFQSNTLRSGTGFDGRSQPSQYPTGGWSPGVPQSVQMQRLSGGGGGFGPSGGLNLWNPCWDSECCDECILWGRCWPTGDGRCIPECLIYRCTPCQRCLFPW
jgi:hypothetical protein